MRIRNLLLLLLAMSVLLYSCEADIDNELGTCSDGIINQNETGIDCGGVCTACASCSDGLLNQGEVRTDCGGPCTACGNCVTCTSTVQGSNPIVYCERDFNTQADYDDAVANARALGRTCN
ncbi:hypothetical protein BH09BAC1_BH09BAC1_30140 [soil metagenome]